MPDRSLSAVQTLAPLSRIALVAPSGPVSATDITRATANVHALGWVPVTGEHVARRHAYFAGTDSERLSDLNGALSDDSIDAVWFVRGGHGATRLLEQLDYDALRRHPKPLIGYSDITALHAAVGCRVGVVTYHGPTARETLTPFSRTSLERALVRGTDPCGHAPMARVVRSGAARGRLAGGNLALLTALAGTPFFPDLDGAILVLEDVNEGLYRVDRMLWHLRMTGALDRLAGIAFGQCTACGGDESPEDARLDRTLDDVLGEIAGRLRVPCLAGIPVGHIAEQWTVPLGAMAHLETDRLTLTVEDDRE